MPPKKAAKAVQKPSLKGCAITFASNSIPANTLSLKNLAEVKVQIAENGGSYVTKVDQCTHLVATDTQYQKDLAKIKEAKDNTAVTILSYDWLEETLSAKAPIDEKDYVLHDRGQTFSGPALANNTKDSKSASAKNEDEEDTPASNNVSKKRKRTAAVKYEEDESDIDEEEPEPELATEKTNGKALNVTKNKALNIPLDEGLIKKQGTHYQVYVDPDDSVIFDVTLSQSDSGDNANKFYRMQLLKNTTSGTWCTWTRWGRVGENGQSALLGGGSFSEAMVQFEKKFKDKTGNTWADRNGPLRAKKYTFIERSYDDSDSEGEEDLPGAEKRRKLKQEPGEEEEEEKKVIKSKLPEPVQDLMKFIFNQDYFKATFDAFDYDAEKMPLGKLSKSTLMRGYEVLKTLSGLVGSAGNANQITTLSNQYLSLIPHVVSRSSRPPVLSSMDVIKKEIELLEALTDMQLANDLMKNAKKEKDKTEELNLLDRQYQGLGMQEMEPISHDTKEFTELEAYLIKSVGHTHGTKYKVQDIFRIERQGEHDRFDQSSYAKVPNKNRRLLWHGSRATNFGGILSQGLRIAPPEAPVNGYMFGKGVYLADMSSKSAGYCSSYSSGNTGLLLLCEAELGEPPLELTNADYDAGTKAKQQDCLSTLGLGRTAPKMWKDASALHPSLTGVTMPDVVSQKPGDTGVQGAYLQYNEYIVYDVAQIKLRYLFRVSM